MGAHVITNIYVLDEERTGEWATALYREYGDNLKTVTCFKYDGWSLATCDPINEYATIVPYDYIKKITFNTSMDSVEDLLKDADTLAVLDDELYEKKVEPILKDNESLAKRVNVVFFKKHPISETFKNEKGLQYVYHRDCR